MGLFILVLCSYGEALLSTGCKLSDTFVPKATCDVAATTQVGKICDRHLVLLRVPLCMEVSILPVSLKIVVGDDASCFCGYCPQCTGRGAALPDQRLMRLVGSFVQVFRACFVRDHSDQRSLPSGLAKSDLGYSAYAVGS